MEAKKPKGQKSFAIVNIIMGVVLIGSSFILFAEGEGLAGVILIILGGIFGVTGAYVLNILKNYSSDEVRMKKPAKINTVCFIISAIILLACMLLPVIYKIS